MEKLELQMRDPSWNATIDKFLPDALKEDPSIVQKIQNSPTPWKDAYHHATHNYSYFKNKMETEQNKDAERMVANAEKPRSLGSTGTQSNVGVKEMSFH